MPLEIEELEQQAAQAEANAIAEAGTPASRQWAQAAVGWRNLIERVMAERTGGYLPRRTVH